MTVGYSHGPCDCGLARRCVHDFDPKDLDATARTGQELQLTTVDATMRQAPEIQLNRQGLVFVG
jgi:hypothetical protein